MVCTKLSVLNSAAAMSDLTCFFINLLPMIVFLPKKTHSNSLDSLQSSKIMTSLELHTLLFVVGCTYFSHSVGAMVSSDNELAAKFYRTQSPHPLLIQSIILQN